MMGRASSSMSEQGLQVLTPKNSVKRGEDVFLTAISQIAKRVARRLNNLSKMDKGVVAGLRIHSFGSPAPR